MRREGRLRKSQDTQSSEFDEGGSAARKRFGGFQHLDDETLGHAEELVVASPRMQGFATILGCDIIIPGCKNWIG